MRVTATHHHGMPPALLLAWAVACGVDGVLRSAQVRISKESRVTVYDIKDPDGRVFAFEVDNSRLGRRRVSKVLARIPGCRIVRRPKCLSWLRESEFSQFEVEGITFVVEEPFGDNSRYWIGPRPPRWVSQIAAVRQAFVDE